MLFVSKRVKFETLKRWRPTSYQRIGFIIQNVKQILDEKFKNIFNGKHFAQVAVKHGQNKLIVRSSEHQLKSCKIN